MIVHMKILFITCVLNCMNSCNSDCLYEHPQSDPSSFTFLDSSTTALTVTCGWFDAHRVRVRSVHGAQSETVFTL